jgi:Holliday junction resolvasome RuvABC endonuclease subunit
MSAVSQPKKRKRATKRAGWRRTGQKRATKVRKRKKVAKQPLRTKGDGAKLLALDVSSTCTGWAYFESGQLKAHGKRRMEGKSHSEKLSSFLDWVLQMFNQLNPTEITFEAPFQGRHANAYGVLSMYKAVMLLCHWRFMTRPFPEENQLPAHIIKKVLGVPKAKGGTTDERHKANKRAVIKVINGLYGTSFRFAEGTEKTAQRSEDDIADAVAVGHTWYTLHISNEEHVDE